MKQNEIQIKLIVSHSIRGQIEPPESVHTVHEGTGQDLIERNIAELLHPQNTTPEETD